MQRIEASKESLRNAILVDNDGADEVAGVSLTPAKWVIYCKLKAQNWYERNGTYSVGQLNAEVDRLERLSLSYKAVKVMTTADPATYPLDGLTDTDAPAPTVDAAKTTLSGKMADLYKARAQLATAVLKKQKTPATDITGDENAVVNAEKALAIEQDNYAKAVAADGRFKIARLQGRYSKILCSVCTYVFKVNKRTQWTVGSAAPTLPSRIKSASWELLSRRSLRKNQSPCLLFLMQLHLMPRRARLQRGPRLHELALNS